MSILATKAELIKRNNKRIDVVSAMTEQLSQSQITRTPMSAKNIKTIKATTKANREAYNGLRKILLDITAEVGLDEEKMANRINSARRSEYGPINGLINLLVSVCNWPAEAGDGSNVAINQKLIEDKYPQIDMLMLDDIKSFRGYHSFVSDDTLQVIDGVEPDYENYRDYCSVLLEDLKLKSIKPTISKDQWQAREASAKVNAKAEAESQRASVERLNAKLNNSLTA
jgi:hypothetical protein